MVDMRPLRVDEDLLDFLRVVATDGTLKEQQMPPDSCETVELMEEGNVVDLALGGGFAWGEVVFGGVGDDYEAVASLGGN